MDNDNLQQTLYALIQSGANSNPAYATLLHDYTRYHAVMLIEGGMFAVVLALLSVDVWRRFKVARIQGRGWTFEKTTYLWFGLASTVAALGMLLIVAANLSNVVHPGHGFAQAIPSLGTPQAGTPKAALHQAVNTWAQSGDDAMPALLQHSVHSRLAWQQPKAVVCSVLLVLFVVLTTRLWQTLIVLRAHGGRWSIRQQALVTTGVLAVPATLLVMIMALANTQASFAPITLTLLFG